MPELEHGIYEHYKGKRYELVSLGYIEATMERVVIYRPLYATPDIEPNSLWVRPLSNFTETVAVGGKEVPRFKLVT